MTGYVEVSDPASLIARFASSLSCVGVDGVTVSATGGQLTGTTDPGLTRLRGAAQHSHLCADVLVSNWDNAINDFSPAIARRLLGSRANVAHVARSLAHLVATQHWDGVTVDLESLSRSDAPGLVSFLHELRVDLSHASDLSVDVSATTTRQSYVESGYDLAGLARSARIVLMAYDDHGPTWSGPGPIGPLSWQRAALAVLLFQVPARDVDLGVAGYGYTWPAGARRHDGVTVSDLAATRLVAASHARARFDATSGEWTARLVNGTTLWWSDARSLAIRESMAAALHLHGVAVWELSTINSLG